MLKKGPFWCEKHQQNHRASTKCPFLPSSTTADKPTTKVESKPPLESGLEGGFPEPTLLVEVGAAKIGGAKKKFFLDHPSTGERYLFKPCTEEFRAQIQQAVSILTSWILPKGEYIPVRAIHRANSAGSLQPFIRNAQPLDQNVSGLDQSILNQIQRERVLDWVFSNHDSHASNLLRIGSVVVGVDKEQSFKHVVDDQLSTTYAPNSSFSEDPPLYNKLYELYAKGELDLDLMAVEPIVSKIESISDEQWMNVLEPYISNLRIPEGRRAIVRKRILHRKQNLRSDIEGFFSELTNRRVGKLFSFEKGLV
jgi:hypothetical protein